MEDMFPSEYDRSGKLRILDISTTYEMQGKIKLERLYLKVDSDIKAMTRDENLVSVL
jgi:hypothetical protein